MCKKSEVLEAIEINTTRINECKAAIRNLEKAKKILCEYGEDWGPHTVVEGVREINEQIDAMNGLIEKHKGWNEKRKKQLKLLEQLEAMENE